MNFTISLLINIGPKLAKEIPGVVKSFKSYVQKVNEIKATDPISTNVIRGAFFPSKNK